MSLLLQILAALGPFLATLEPTLKAIKGIKKIIDENKDEIRAAVAKDHTLDSNAVENAMSSLDRIEAGLLDEPEKVPE